MRMRACLGPGSGTGVERMAREMEPGEEICHASLAIMEECHDGTMVKVTAVHLAGYSILIPRPTPWDRFTRYAASRPESGAASREAARENVQQNPRQPSHARLVDGRVLGGQVRLGAARCV